MPIGANQTYLAVGNLLAMCAMVGIDACPMEGFNVEGVEAELALSERGLRVCALVALGHRTRDAGGAPPPKVRFAREEVITRLA